MWPREARKLYATTTFWIIWFSLASKLIVYK